MKAILKVGIAGFVLAGVTSMFPAVADDTQMHVDRGISLLNAMDKLIDGIKTRQASAGTGAGTGAELAETMKCAACGMEMSTVNTNAKFKAFEINGKTFYCCTGCKMKNARRK